MMISHTFLKITAGIDVDTFEQKTRLPRLLIIDIPKINIFLNHGIPSVPGCRKTQTSAQSFRPRHPYLLPLTPRSIGYKTKTKCRITPSPCISDKVSELPRTDRQLRSNLSQMAAQNTLVTGQTGSPIERSPSGDMRNPYTALVQRPEKPDRTENARNKNYPHR